VPPPLPRFHGCHHASAPATTRSATISGTIRRRRRAGSMTAGVGGVGRGCAEGFFWSSIGSVAGSFKSVRSADGRRSRFGRAKRCAARMNRDSSGDRENGGTVESVWKACLSIQAGSPARPGCARSMMLRPAPGAVYRPFFLLITTVTCALTRAFDGLRRAPRRGVVA
jgi:hypothetical protein